MAANTQGAANGFGTYGGSSGSMTPITFTVYDAAGTTLGSGFVMPTVEDFSLTHNFDVSNTRKGNGDYDSHTVSGGYVEAQFTLAFTGSSAANQAAGERGFPEGSTVVISGAPVRACGPWSDCLNVTSGGLPDTARWHPMPGMSFRRSSTGPSTGTITMRRYPGIVGGAAIVT